MEKPVATPVRPGDFDFTMDPRIKDPSRFRTAFIVLLDGDLVMSPEHLGIALMAAVLRRAGFKADIFEVELGHEREVLEKLVDTRPQLVCFTLMSVNIDSCLRFCALLKEKLPDVPIACGGPAGTYASVEVLRHLPVDIVAIGEGEPTIFELVQALYTGDDLAGCAGICYRAPDGTLKRNPLRPFLHNLDDLPFPARDQFEMHGELEYFRISTSRGCVARCTFCSAPNISNKIQTGKAWRARCPESVVEEIAYLVKHYDFRTFDFVDSTFEDPDGARIGKTRIARIAQGILDLNLEIFYNCCMRAENWSDGDHDLLELLVRSGMEKVNIGIESGNEADLRLWNKRATLADNIRVIRLLREHEIYLAMGFLQFHPYSTIETVKTNALFLKEHRLAHNLRRLTERLEIYPGTVIAKKLEADGLLGENYKTKLDIYDYRFRDEAVGRLAVHFASLYNNEDYYVKGVITENSAVFEFETFSVIIETYLSRIKRKFGHIPAVRDKVAEFRSMLQDVRWEIAQHNYEFFMDNLAAVLEGRWTPEMRCRQVTEIEHLFTDRVKFLKAQQLRLGKSLLRSGADVTRISSTMKTTGKGAPRTYTGAATACW